MDIRGEAGIAKGGRLSRVGHWGRLAQDCGYSVRRVAGACRVSERQLQKFFKIRFGISPREKMRLLRMQRARSLLGKHIAIKMVAFELGYTHVSNFSRDFKGIFGCSATMFRSRLRRVVTRNVR
jgi:transcriptional regulator GlxA family with amidase domain